MRSRSAAPRRAAAAALLASPFLVSGPALACSTCDSEVTLTADEARCVQEQTPGLIEREADPALIFRHCDAAERTIVTAQRTLMACIPGADCEEPETAAETGSETEGPAETSVDEAETALASRAASSEEAEAAPLILRYEDMLCLDGILSGAELDGAETVTVSFAADCAAP